MTTLIELFSYEDQDRNTNVHFIKTRESYFAALAKMKVTGKMDMWKFMWTNCTNSIFLTPSHLEENLQPKNRVIIGLKDENK